MATLKKRRVGPLEEEFCIYGSDFAVGLYYRDGTWSKGRALEFLMERRWSKEDAELFLQMAAQARP